MIIYLLPNIDFILYCLYYFMRFVLGHYFFKGEALSAIYIYNLIDKGEAAFTEKLFYLEILALEAYISV